MPWDNWHAKVTRLSTEYRVRTATITLGLPIVPSTWEVGRRIFLIPAICQSGQLGIGE